jgi:hypothetical protein
MRDDSPQVPAGRPAHSSIAVLDVAAFAQLLTLAKQSGLAINTDAIQAARDREFREGQYQRASDLIEKLYVQLNTQAARRQSELRRQEMQYKSGTLKMTPKQWMDRQRRATEQTQKIDRARRQFTRVLDGLNALRAANPE